MSKIALHLLAEVAYISWLAIRAIRASRRPRFGRRFCLSSNPSFKTSHGLLPSVRFRSKLNHPIWVPMAHSSNIALWTYCVVWGHFMAVLLLLFLFFFSLRKWSFYVLNFVFRRIWLKRPRGIWSPYYGVGTSLWKRFLVFFILTCKWVFSRTARLCLLKPFTCFTANAPVAKLLWSSVNFCQSRTALVVKPNRCIFSKKLRAVIFGQVWWFKIDCKYMVDRQNFSLVDNLYSVKLHRKTLMSTNRNQWRWITGPIQSVSGQPNSENFSLNTIKIRSAVSAMIWNDEEV